MVRNPLALAAILAMQATAFEAVATACTAGNPDTASVAESTPTNAFTDHGDGTLTHNLTGLMWKRCAQGQSGANCSGTATNMTWRSALDAAVFDRTAGHGDWHLPNLKELESIVESCGYNTAINQFLFPATPPALFWSSSSYAPGPTSAWYVNFSSGVTDIYAKSGDVYVRLVRGGQSLGSFDTNHPTQMTLDIDGNGAADALTDGLLVIRYLFGLRGAALIQSAVGTGAQRSTAADIGTYLQSITPQ